MEKNLLEKVDFILSAGSVDGICTSAAVLRQVKGRTIKTAFCQAFTVDKLEPTSWGEETLHVLFVDLAVNSRKPEMTTSFLRRITEAGHKIVGVLDEHDAESWQKAFLLAEIKFDDLAIKPVSQKKCEIKSSGALLLSLLDREYPWPRGKGFNMPLRNTYIDGHTRELLEAAAAGDQMDFSTHFGGLINEAVKSDIADDSRRVYLTKHFAQKNNADEKILGWISEYEVILVNHDKIVRDKISLEEGALVRVCSEGKKIDPTTLMSRLYKEGARIVVLKHDIPFKKESKDILSIGTPDRSLDLMEIIRGAGVNPLGGFTQKVNINLEDEYKSVMAIRREVF